MNSIGFVGLGSMGQPMVHDLLKVGWKVKVFNRSAAKDLRLFRH